MKRKIVLREWRGFHPHSMIMSTDWYYTELANKVFQALQGTPVDKFFNDDEIRRDLALRLTAWFEDICSNLGFYRTFNNVCKQRYGRPIPFYNIDNYVVGEPNEEDLRFLLWDYLQSHKDDTFSNPENIGIKATAIEVLSVFDEEYETAPETSEMIELLSNASLEDDYWQMRDLCEWFATSSYLTWRCQEKIRQKEKEMDNDKEWRDKKKYLNKVDAVFNDCSNILSIPSYQWLSYVTGKKIDVKIDLFSPHVYRLISVEQDYYLMRRVLDDGQIEIQRDSIDLGFLKTMDTKVGKQFWFSVLQYNGKYYQIGVMIHDDDVRSFEHLLEQEKKQAYKKKYVADDNKLFKEKMGKQHFFYCRANEIAEKFFEEKLGLPMDESAKQSIQQNEVFANRDIPVAITYSKEEGFLFIVEYVEAIRDKKNPYYDKLVAKRDAHKFFLSPYVIDYEHICYMIDNNMLPDAAINSLYGYIYGKRFLKVNAQYIVDYMFSRHR